MSNHRELPDYLPHNKKQFLYEVPFLSPEARHSSASVLDASSPLTGQGRRKSFSSNVQRIRRNDLPGSPGRPSPPNVVNVGCWPGSQTKTFKNHASEGSSGSDPLQRKQKLYDLLQEKDNSVSTVPCKSRKSLFDASLNSQYNQHNYSSLEAVDPNKPMKFKQEAACERNTVLGGQDFSEKISYQKNGMNLQDHEAEKVIKMRQQGIKDVQDGIRRLSSKLKRLDLEEIVIPPEIVRDYNDGGTFDFIGVENSNRFLGASRNTSRDRQETSNRYYVSSACRSGRATYQAAKHLRAKQHKDSRCSQLLHEVENSNDTERKKKQFSATIELVSTPPKDIKRKQPFHMFHHEDVKKQERIHVHGGDISSAKDLKLGLGSNNAIDPSFSELLMDSSDSDSPNSEDSSQLSEALRNYSSKKMSSILEAAHRPSQEMSPCKKSAGLDDEVCRFSNCSRECQQDKACQTSFGENPHCHDNFFLSTILHRPTRRQALESRFHETVKMAKAFIKLFCLAMVDLEDGCIFQCSKDETGLYYVPALPNFKFVRPKHVKYGIHASVSRLLFDDIDKAPFGSKVDSSHLLQEFESFLMIAAIDAINPLNDCYDKPFHRFCSDKLQLLEMKMPWLVNWSDHLLQAFLDAMKYVWQTHVLMQASSFAIRLLFLNEWSEFDGGIMEVVDPDHDSSDFLKKVQFVITPGFQLQESVLKSEVYLVPKMH